MIGYKPLLEYSTLRRPGESQRALKLSPEIGIDGVHASPIHLRSDHTLDEVVIRIDTRGKAYFDEYTSWILFRKRDRDFLHHFDSSMLRKAQSLYRGRKCHLFGRGRRKVRQDLPCPTDAGYCRSKLQGGQ